MYYFAMAIGTTVQTGIGQWKGLMLPIKRHVIPLLPLGTLL